MRIKIHNVISNTFWLTFGQVFLRISKILIISLAVIYLGIENYGVISIVLAFISIFYIPASLFHILSPMVRDFSSKSVFDYSEISKNLSWRLVLGFTAVVLGIIGFLFYPYGSLVFIIIGLSLFFDYVKDFFNALLESKSDMKSSGLVFILHALLTFILGFISLKFYGSIISLSISYAVSSFAALVLSVFMLKKYDFNLNNFRPALPNVKSIKSYFSEGFGFGFFWALFSSFVFQIIIVCLSFLTTEGEVAVVSIVFQILQALLMPYFVFSYSNLPPLSKILNTDGFSKRLSKFLMFPIITTLPYLSLATVLLLVFLPIIFIDTHNLIMGYFFSIGITSFIFLPTLVSLTYALLLTNFFKRRPYFIGLINLLLLVVLVLSVFVFDKNVLFFGLPIFYVISTTVLWIITSKELDISSTKNLLKKEILPYFVLAIFIFLLYERGFLYWALALPVIYFLIRIKFYYSYFKNDLA